MSRNSRRKPFRLRRWVTLAGAVLAVLVAAELSLRLLGLLLAAPGHAARRDGERVILCVGDSWTHGLGTKSYAEVLEDKLDARVPGAGIHVVRAGVPGHNSSQGLLRLEALLPLHDPDLLIVLLGNNDHQNVAETEYWKFDNAAESGLRMWGARLRVGLHSLRLFKLARSIFLAASGRPTPDEFYRIEDLEISPNARATAVDPTTHDRLLRYNLMRIVELARRNDAEVLFMTYFYFHGYRVNETISDVAYGNGVPLVDNTVRFHERIPANERGLYLYGGHPTAKGHRFIAENIIEVLEQAGSKLLEAP